MSFYKNLFFTFGIAINQYGIVWYAHSKTLLYFILPDFMDKQLRYMIDDLMTTG